MKKNKPEDSTEGRRYCGAKTRAGTPCRKAPIAGRGRCRNHGGKSPIKHGMYSKYKRAIIADRINKYLDADRDLSGELAVLRGILDKHLEDGELGHAEQTIDTLSRVLKRIQDVENANAISMKEFIRLQTAMAAIVAKYVDSEVTLRKIRDGWLDLRVD